MKGELKLSFKNARQIIERSEMTRAEARLFSESVSDDFKIAVDHIDVPEDGDFELLKDDEFSKICAWHFYAIRNLADLNDSLYDPTWVAERLAIPTEVARDALEILVDLKLIEISNEKFIRPKKPIRTSQDIDSISIQKYHRSILEKAAEMLPITSVEIRDYGSFTAACSAEMVPEIKELIREFRRELGEFVKSSQNPTQVFTFATQLFPVSNVEAVDS
jgi:uncharacterized protein (TIGR02147 family)